MVTSNEDPAIEHIQRVRIYGPRGHDTHRRSMFDTEPSQPGGYGRDVEMTSLSIVISSSMSAYDILALGTVTEDPTGFR